MALAQTYQNNYVLLEEKCQKLEMPQKRKEDGRFGRFVKSVRRLINLQYIFARVKVSSVIVLVDVDLLQSASSIE